LRLEERSLRVLYLTLYLLPSLAVVALTWFVVRAVSVRVTWRDSDPGRLDDEPA
jgi:hypothetical protein